MADRAATRTSPAATTCSTRAAATVIPYDGRRLYGVCCRREGHVPLHAHAPAASPATPRSRRSATTRCSSSRRVLAARSATADAGLRRHRRAAGAARGARRGPADPDGGARARSRAREPRLARDRRADARRHARADAHLRLARRSTSSRRGRELQRRLPRAARAWASEDGARRASARCSASDGYELEFTEQVVGNRSPVESPLMDAIARAGSARRTPAREVVPTSCPASPTRAGGAPPSRTASPTASSRSATRRSTRPGR